MSGLVAAAQAYADGKLVAVLDQEPSASVGGQAHWSFGGLFLVNSPEQRRLGVKDSAELALGDWLASAAFDRPEARGPGCGRRLRGFCRRRETPLAEIARRAALSVGAVG
ncbi:FAD-binding protein [Arthrobacter sp. Hiyo1]|uniref:FAD-binding protein n=1 Tax=Arthrobacter sp. Hiyo1 TaxID=1588020 RepID=UPI00209C564B|nr:FAD-binding protein [Arthrobacter sp. Hiyo1]